MSQRAIVSGNENEVALSVTHRLIKVQRAMSVVAIFIFMYFGVSGVSMAGSGFTEQGNTVSKALKDYLIAQGVCKDYQNCHNMLQMYREDGGGRIYFNMYGQKDKALSSMVAGFLVTNGLQITGGMPITLSVFDEPKTQHMGFMAGIGKNKTSIKLEINK